MKLAIRHLILSVLLMLPFAGVANAQYIWMDTNGDGVNTSADVLNANGTPTTVNVYINTEHNADGSLATCNTSDGDLAVWNSFAMHINTVGGTATFTNYVNQVTAFTIGCVDVGVGFRTNSSTEMSACQATGAPVDNGGANILMFTVTVTGVTGAPSLQFVQLNTQDANFTSFGTSCSGNDFDNTYKLGSDFTDNAGVGPAVGANNPPVLVAPTTVNGTEGSLVTVTASASDPDGGELVTLTQTTTATFLTGPSSAGPSATPSITLSGTPTFTQAGTYTITWTATDNNASPATTTATTTVIIANLDQAPTVSAPATVTGAENTLITFTVTASDPDGDAIFALGAAPLPSGATFTSNAAHTSGTFSWTPTDTQAGTYNITFTATNALTGTATTAITVTNADQAPVVTAPATVSGASNSLITFTVTASDPDGDAITSLTASPLPTGATFTANATNTSGTFSWTPTNAQVGTTSVTFTASNSLTGTATTSITVSSGDLPPVVTAPATVSGDENTLITFTVSANDPDGDAIASLTASPLPSGATFTANATNTAGTFSWTPDYTQSGTYNVTFTATNALGGTATTSITVNNVDRAPVVTAPPTASGVEGDVITFTVTASDPDGDAITSLTASPLPAGATFTANATNTSGTFTWTTGAGDAGSYNVTFTAANALTGTATTAITVTTGDHAPVVTAPATASGDEGTNINFVVTASDSDGDAITSLTASPLPTGATFTVNATNTSGTFDWTPDLTQSGTYNVVFTASNALSGSATTAITVNNADQAPTVSAPATASGDEGTLITFVVTASDPDGDAITSLSAAPLPAGATFTANATNTSGTFSWTPSATQSGTYTVVFTAANALTGSASTDITVNNVDAAPVVTAPATASGPEGSLITFVVTASDPDGDAITSLTSSPLPPGATFTTDATNTSGTFEWTPATGDAGSYSVTFTASNTLSGSATTLITVGGVNHDPVVSSPATVTVDEGQLLTFTVTATDADGDHVTLTALGTPAGASFTDNGDNTGTFTWTPSFTQSGSYTVTFQGTDGNGGTGTSVTVITVNDVNRAPTADAGGPYTGVIGVAVSFDGSGSSDPDGDVLTYAWDFGDGGTSSDPNPTHTYTAAGVYTVTLTVTDPSGLTSVATTTATISSTLSAAAFTVGGNKTTSLSAGKPYTCVQIEAVDSSFPVTDVTLSSIKMVSVGTGSVTEIFADASKTAVDGDKNGNGVQEITACFTKSDLRLLFGGLPAGRNTVNVTIEGTLISGAPFSAPLTLIVKSTGATLAASISPNPLNPQAKLTFATTKPGAVRVQMFDAQGRLVKTIAEENSVQAGYHDFTIDGRTATGSKLASGVYFVKVWSQFDGSEIKSVTILK